jgi:PAS domain S-box-containing protein
MTEAMLRVHSFGPVNGFVATKGPTPSELCILCDSWTVGTCTDRNGDTTFNKGGRLLSGPILNNVNDAIAGRRQEQRWQALLDSAGEGIWGVDLEGNCTFVNRMASQIFGYSSHEMLGHNMHALVHHHYDDGRVYPDSECPVYSVFRENKPFRQRMDTMFRKDGGPFLAEMSAQPVTVDETVIGVVVTFRDVSERYRQQQELQRAYDVAAQRTAELDAVIESIPHGVFIATEGKVRTNRRAREMTGEGFPSSLQTLEKALSGEASTETVRLSDCWIRSVAAPIQLDGQVLGGVAVNTDITQSRLQDDALRKSEKLAAVGQLASSIAHEINNPLESLTNLLYLVRHAGSLGEVQDYVKIAESELARVSEITLQTLRFHRQQNKPVLSDFADLLSSIVSLYTGRFLVRGVSVEWKITSTPTCYCLEGEIRQVINNLIRNAVDAMPTGGRLYVRLRPACGPQMQPGVRITIGDTGEGISPHILGHLFEPFHTTKEVTGTGLGLWVSKGIVDKHGGSISVRTRRDAPHGTIFAIWLPLEGAPGMTAGD